jgi:hypothetical protein
MVAKQSSDGSFLSKLASRAINVFASLPENSKAGAVHNSQEIACVAAERFVAESANLAPAARSAVVLALAKALVRQSQHEIALKWLGTAQKLLEVRFV